MRSPSRLHGLTTHPLTVATSKVVGHPSPKQHGYPLVFTKHRVLSVWTVLARPGQRSRSDVFCRPAGMAELAVVGGDVDGMAEKVGDGSWVAAWANQLLVGGRVARVDELVTPLKRRWLAWRGCHPALLYSLGRRRTGPEQQCTRSTKHHPAREEADGDERHGRWKPGQDRQAEGDKGGG